MGEPQFQPGDMQNEYFKIAMICDDEDHALHHSINP
jgi:hypothetical protein